MKVIEQLGYHKINMRYWKVYINNDIHLGWVGYNKDSGNIHFKFDSEYRTSLAEIVVNKNDFANYIAKAMDMVKNELIDEILLETL